MAWTTIETPNAKYVLLFFYHGIGDIGMTAEKVPEKFDALVLEKVGGVEVRNMPVDFQYRNVVKQAIEHGKHIWITDAAPSGRSVIRALAGAIAVGIAGGKGVKTLLEMRKKKELNRRSFVKRVFGIGLLLPLLGVMGGTVAEMHHKEIKHHKLWKINTKIGNLVVGAGIGTARDLLTAEKCESWLAPKLQQELGRKPTIAMVWGGGHYDIRDLLLHPAERQRLLQKHDLEKYLKADYPKSFRIELKPDGTIKEIKEFQDTLSKAKKPAELPKPKAKQSELFGRRQFLSSAFKRMLRI